MTTIVPKKIYNTPSIELIKLDNEISLILESAGSNPGEPGTTGSLFVPEHFNNDPFKSNMS